MSERRDRDLIGQRNAMYAGETQKNRERKFIKSVLMFSFAFEY